MTPVSRASRVRGTNVHIYPAPLRHQSRMQKITRTLAEAAVFDRIILVGVATGRSAEREELDDRREIVGLPRRLFSRSSHTFGKAIRTVEWYWRVVRALAREPVACVNCHSLPVLPLCAALARWKRSKLVYDTHELETETVASTGVRKALQKLVERLLIRRADEIIVVNEPIADWYRKNYNLQRVWVVKNVPYNSGPTPARSSRLRDLYGMGEEDIIFLYLGGLWHGRGTKALLDAFSTAGLDRHLVMMGFGEMVPLVEEYSARYRNIHYHPSVKPEEIGDIAAGADVGLSLIENVCLSYFLCLPNKVFEYITSGVPVLVSDFPVMGELIDRCGCGWKAAPATQSIREAVMTITPASIRAKREAALSVRATFGWQYEEPSLLKVYEGLFPGADDGMASGVEAVFTAP